jgi:hypothetical protein
MAISGYFHVTPSGAGTKSGADWSNSFGLSEFSGHLVASGNPGYVYFVSSGTYNFSGTIDSNLRDGGIVAPLAIIGVKSNISNTNNLVTYTDWAISPNDRPLFNTGAYLFKGGDYYIFRNISVIGQQVTTFGNSAVVENCKFNNNYGTPGNRYALTISAASSVINNEITSLCNEGLNAFGADSKILYNNFINISNSTYGIAITTTSKIPVIAFNIFNNCAYGILTTADNHGVIINNTFYSGIVGISMTTDYNTTIINNIFEGYTSKAITASTRTDSNFFWKNHGDNTRNIEMYNGVDTSGIFMDYLNSSGNPLFTSSGNLSLTAGSPCINNGMSITLGVS